VADGAPPARPRTKLFHLVDWLPPDFGATGQYALMFATDEARAGRDVHLIGLTTGPPSMTVEEFRGGGCLAVSRVRASKPDKASNLGRLVWAARMNGSLIRRVLFSARGPAPELMFTGSPPFMLYFAIAAKYLTGAKLTYRITDFYPEVVMASMRRRSPLLSLVSRLTWFFRKRVDRFQVLGEDQRRLLLEAGIAGERIRLVRDRSPVAFSPDVVPGVRPADLGGRLALLYSGNYGVAHEVDTVVEGATRHHLRGSDRVALWINATGVNAVRVAAALRAAAAPVAHTPPAALADLAGLLMSADAHLITLRDGFAGLVLPSKVYACLASGKPIIFVGPEASDVHLLCSQSEGVWYRRVEPGDASEFSRALEDLADVLALAGAHRDAVPARSGADATPATRVRTPPRSP
jgi:hypothetical protein